MTERVSQAASLLSKVPLLNNLSNIVQRDRAFLDDLCHHLGFPADDANRGQLASHLAAQGFSTAQEYPKAIYSDDGRKLLGVANDAKEEAFISAAKTPAAPMATDQKVSATLDAPAPSK